MRSQIGYWCPADFYSAFFKRWSRYAEITCDRAGLICCGDVRTAELAFVKLIIGSGDSLKQINIDKYLQQMSKNPSPPMQMQELYKNIATKIEQQIENAYSQDIETSLSVMQQAQTVIATKHYKRHYMLETVSQ
ncbi:hypothetical protein [Fischerella thermalis]|uniref:hypothetical protein n=1 Tax=Fischerella thermalis TaxID=372787 RepID=UPI0021553E7A|nr:hypothetical protein [Fischerella thermalis]